MYIISPVRDNRVIYKKTNLKNTFHINIFALLRKNPLVELTLIVYNKMVDYRCSLNKMQYDA